MFESWHSTPLLYCSVCVSVYMHIPFPSAARLYIFIALLTSCTAVVVYGRHTAKVAHEDVTPVVITPRPFKMKDAFD